MTESIPRPPVPPGGKKKTSRKVSKKTLQMLALGWVGLVLIVLACMAVGVFWALTRQDDGDQVAEADGDAQDAEAEPDAAPDEPTPTPAPTLIPNQDDSFGYGIQIQAHKDTERTLDMVEQLGMNWIKQQIRWKDLEPAQGQANWDALDAIFAATGERDIKVMVSVLAAPDWARSVTAEGLEGPPDDPTTYATYVGEMIRRYQGRIHAVEIWNEQNIEREWYTAGGLSAQGYVALLQPASAAIRAADPGVIIISGALAPTGFNDAQARNDLLFMQEMIDAGLLDYVDCVGSHANGINLPPDIAYDAGYNDASALFRGPFDNPHPSWSFYSTLRSYNDLVVAAGRDTPQCVTEFGWASIEGMQGEPRQGFDFAIDNSLEEQSENIVRAYQLMHEWEFVRLAFLFNLDYSPKAGGNPQDDTTLFSILTPEGAPRPAFEAIRAMPKPE